MNRVDYLEWAAAHARMLRRSIKDPSADTLALWALEDARREALMRYYDAQEADEPVNVHITQEVKR